MKRDSSPPHRPTELDPTETIPGHELGARPGSEPERVPTLLAGRFVLLHRLGQGGMGEVYAAYDPELDRKVAVKLLRGWRAATLGGAHVRHEARALARLSHPNVVRVYDVAGTGEELAIAMELVEGETLKQWLEKKQRTWRQIVELFLAAGRGLAAAHAAGVTHRDFKPSNVMVTQTGEVRVVDFGIALGSDEGSGKALIPSSSSGSRAGTPAYAPPEAFSPPSGEARFSDPRGDQFSFCVALYEALCGEHPFLTPEDRAGALENAPVYQLRDPQRSSRLPGWLERAVLRGLERDPAARFPTMSALLAVLEAGLRRRRRVWLAAAGVALVLVGGLAGRWLGPGVGRDSCAGAESQLEGVWDAARKQQIRAAFEATGLEPATIGWPRVEAALDRYAADWLAMKRDACAATGQRGEQSEQLLDLRLLCLDGRLSELRVLSERFAAADREVAVRASEAVGGLGALAGCASSVELAAMVPLPTDPELHARVERLHVAIEGQAARVELSAIVDRDLAERQIEEARGLGYPPLVARALALEARLKLEAGAVAEAGAAAEEALWAAVAGRDWLQQARLHGLLLTIRGFYQADATEGRRWRHATEASIEALGAQHPELELEARLRLARYAAIIDENAAVTMHAGRALEIGERLWGPEDLRLASAHNLLGFTAAGTPEGRRHLERALEISERQLGPQNPRLAPALVNLAAEEATVGRYEQALALGERALGVLEGFYPGGGSEVAFPEIFVAQILTLQDRADDAETRLRHALGSAVATFGAEHELVFHAHASLARVEILQGRLDAAGEAIAETERIAAAAMSETSENYLEALLLRGQWWLERGRPERALAVFEQTWARLRPGLFPPTRRSALLGGMGEAELTLGRRERAREHLEAGLELARPGVFPLDNARLRFALARVLPVAERARARELAAAALAELPGKSPLTRRLRGEVEAWLTASPPAHPLG